MKGQKTNLLFVSIIISSYLCNLSDQQLEPYCMRQCGDIDIPWPFGIGPSCCYLNANFTVICNNTSISSRTPILKKFNFEILSINPNYDGYDGNHGMLIVKIPALYTCGSTSNDTTKVMWTMSQSFTLSPFSLPPFEDDANVFVSVGCDGSALLYNETGGIIAGCASACRPNPPQAITVSRSRCYGYHCCQETLSIEDSQAIQQYSISVSINSTSGNCRSAFLVSKKYLEAGHGMLEPGSTAVPVVLFWGHNLFWGDNQPAGGLGPSYIILILVVCIPLVTCGGGWGFWLFKTKKRRKEIKLRAKYFKEKLEAQGSSRNRRAGEKIKLFTLTELKRYTDNFNKDRVLGQGGQGTVYKGMLKDEQVVAVKKSRALDQSQWKQFINEVILLSQIKHRHIVKILGCCLEDDIPLVVYEFISNGTLSEHIKSSLDEFTFTWEMRLGIAFEAASAIAYLHSEFTTPIYHRDIKSSNILLDDKLRAKLSDFGISRAVSMEQTHLTTCVQGTFGYLDPEYFYSSQYSEKSDVYSFGVVLVELLTGQKPIRAQRQVDDEINTNEDDEEERSLVTHFVSSMNDSTLFSIVDPIILEGGTKEDILEFANLALQCLKPRGLERPAMKEVATVLEQLRCRTSSCMLLTENEQAGDSEIGCSEITSLDTIRDASFRPVTYDYIDSNRNSSSDGVEMRLLQTT